MSSDFDTNIYYYIVGGNWHKCMEIPLLFVNFLLPCPQFHLPALSADPAAGRHPAAGGLVGPPDDRRAPQRLRSPEKPGVRQSQRRQQDRPEELRRNTSSGATAPEDHRCGDPRAAHR